MSIANQTLSTQVLRVLRHCRAVCVWNEPQCQASAFGPSNTPSRERHASKCGSCVAVANDQVEHVAVELPTVAAVYRLGVIGVVVADRAIEGARALPPQ